MKYGFTTGSCAAAASKAAAYMLLAGVEKKEIQIMTPKGIPFQAQVREICRKENEVSCAVEKDGGDDPDITTGSFIFSKVRFGARGEGTEASVVIKGGTGVGRVTKVGLDQPVGSAAINHVPREMISREVLEVCNLLDYQGEILVEIYVPNGEELAQKTFNPRLGIVGGISILGTSGIVEPMSQQAILDTIRVQLYQRRTLGFDYVAVSFGNYGLDFMKNTYGYDLDRSIKCSNFIGKTIDMAVELGFQKMLLTGHIGKMIKLSGGIMNTHSSEADCRMELLGAFSARAQVDPEKVCAIMDCVTTEAAIHILEETGKSREVLDFAMERICYFLEKRAKGKMQIACIMYANEFGELAKSKGVDEWFTLLEREQEQ